MTRVLLLLLLILLSPSMAQEYKVEPVPDLEALLVPLQAMPDPLLKQGDVLPLAECLRISRESHPALQASWAQLLQSQASLKQVWALYYPTASLSLAEDVKETFFSRMDSRSLTSQLGIDRSATASLSLTQTIFDSGARAAQVQAARQALLSQYFDYETAWVNQAYKVQSAYLNTVEQEQLLVVTLFDLKRVTTNRSEAQRFLEAGTKSLVDVTQSEIQVAQAQANLAAQRQAVRDAWLALAQAMNVDAETIKERRLEALLMIETEVPPLETSLRELESHPELLSFTAQENSVLSSATAEKRSLRPSLDLSTSLQGYRKSPVETGLWDVQLTLSIPLFNPSIKPKMAEYEAQALQAQKEAENTRLGLVQQLKTAYSNKRGAREQASASRRRTKTALLNYDLAKRRYKAGLTDYTELLNALSFISAAQSSYVAALADERRAEISLLQSTGAAAQFSKTYFRVMFERDIGENLDSFEK